jgi:hypothetical protein
VFYLTILPIAKTIWNRWRMIEIGVWSIRGIILAGVNLSNRRKTCPSVT